MKRLAVIGLGNISNRHRKNLRAVYPESTIISMSSSGRALDKLPPDADIVVNSIEEVINYNPSMAIIASPATLHKEHSIPLINADIPVLIEKPIAASLMDSSMIIDALKFHKVPTAIGYCLRYLNSSKEIKKALDSDLIGELYNVFVEVGQYLPDWRANKNYKDSVSASEALGGGALLELSHEIDYIQWLVGDLIPQFSILRSSKTLGLDVEDSADILSINSKGVVISMHLDFLQRTPHRKCRFIGSNGSLEWNLIKNTIVLNGSNQREIIFSDPDWDKNKMYLNMILDFENLILGRPNQCVTPYEAANTISFISRVKRLNKNRN